MSDIAVIHLKSQFRGKPNLAAILGNLKHHKTLAMSGIQFKEQFLQHRQLRTGTEDYRMNQAVLIGV